MEEVKNAATSLFIGFLMIILGFILILTNLLQYSQNYHTITYIMVRYNLIDLVFYFISLSSAIFFASQGYVYIDIDGYLKLLTGPSPELSWFGMGVAFIGFICIALSIKYTINFDDEKGPFTLFFSFLAFYTIFNCIMVGVGINELADSRKLINSMELFGYMVWDSDITLFSQIHQLCMWIAASASNAPAVYTGLTSLLVIAILLLIVAIYLAKQSAKSKLAHKHNIVRHKPRSSTPKSFRISTNTGDFLQNSC